MGYADISALLNMLLAGTTAISTTMAIKFYAEVKERRDREARSNQRVRDLAQQVILATQAISQPTAKQQQPASQKPAAASASTTRREAPASRPSDDTLLNPLHPLNAMQTHHAYNPAPVDESTRAGGGSCSWGSSDSGSSSSSSDSCSSSYD